jgi:hypothetical protein
MLRAMGAPITPTPTNPTLLIGTSPGGDYEAGAERVKRGDPLDTRTGVIIIYVTFNLSFMNYENWEWGKTRRAARASCCRC